MKEMDELRGDGRSIRGIARELGVSRNSVSKEVAAWRVAVGKEEGQTEMEKQARPVRGSMAG